MTPPPARHGSHRVRRRTVPSRDSSSTARVLLYDAKGDPITHRAVYITGLRGRQRLRGIIAESSRPSSADFDGIQMDIRSQSWRTTGKGRGRPVTASQLINEAAARLGTIERAPGSLDVGVIFNAVNDWPIDTVAISDQECVYIEVWNPHSRYSDLVALVRRARDLSGKQAILSAYLQPFRDGGDSAEWALRYVTAVIEAAGGHHLVLGEAPPFYATVLPQPRQVVTSG